MTHTTRIVDTALPAYMGGKQVICSCGWRSRNIGNYQSTQFHDLREMERKHLAEKRG